MALVLLLIAYLISYPPNLTKYVFGGDSAELVTALSQFGIPHPPGYPLLALIGNIFVRIIPFFNIYQKLSLMNSLFTLGTAFIVYLTLKLIVKREIIALFGSIFLMFLFPIWLYSLVPEVFSLAILLISIQIYAIISLYLHPTLKISLYKNIFLLSLGLSIAHHHLFIFFLPGYFWLIHKKSNLKKIFLNKIWINLFLVSSGLLFYFYALIASYYNTPLDVENAKTLRGLINLITRASYGTFKAYSWVESDIPNRLFNIFSTFIFVIHDFKPLGMLFIFIGIVYLYRKNKKLFYFFLINSFSIIFFYFYSNFYLNNPFGVATHERFLTFLYLILIFYFTIGIFYSYKLFLLFIQITFHSILLKKIAIVTYYTLIIGFFLITYLKNYKIISKINNLKIFDNFGQDILKTPTKNSVLILKGDNSLFITQNLYFVKNLRKDLTIITFSHFDRSYLQTKSNINPKVIFPKKSFKTNGEMYSYFFKTNFQQRINVFAEQPFSEGIWVPYGLLWKYYPNFEVFNKERETLAKINRKLWKSYTFPKIDSDLANILFIKDIQSYYARQIWATVNYYIINNQLKLAFEFANKYYSELNDNYHFLLTFINLNVSNKNCNKQVRSSVEKILKMKIKNSVDYTPLLNYYKICEKTSQKYLKLQKEFLEFKKNEDISLEKL